MIIPTLECPEIPIAMVGCWKVPYKPVGKAESRLHTRLKGTIMNHLQIPNIHDVYIPNMGMFIIVY